MVKRAFICILMFAFIVVQSSWTFWYAAQICGEVYAQAPDGVDGNGEQVTHLVPLAEDRLAIVGKYTAGPSTGDLYYRIYDQGGQALQSGHFNLAGSHLQIEQAFVQAGDLKLVCIANTRGETSGAYGVVYTISLNGQVRQSVLYQGAATDTLYGFERFVAADSQGAYYAGIYKQRVVIFDAAGQVVLRLNPEQMKQVMDVRYAQEIFYLAGCTSESGSSDTVHRAVCMAYDLEGTALWRKNVMGEEGVLASVLRMVDRGDGEWLLYGRFAENATDPQITASQQIEAFEAYEGGFHFKVDDGASGALDSAAFLLRLSRDGDILERVAYSEASGSPAMMVGSLDLQDDLWMQAYLAADNQAPLYTVKLIRLNGALQEQQVTEVPVWSDTEVRVADGWVYCSVPEQHKQVVLYGLSETELQDYFTQLKRWRPVCEAARSWQAGLPLFIGLYTVRTMCVMGTVRDQSRRGRRKA